MKNNKNKKIIILSIILFVIICYFVDKTYLLFKYNISIENETFTNITESLRIKETLTITTNNNENSYILFDDIKIKNIFDDFTMTEQKSNIVKYKSNTSSKVSFIARIDKTYLDMLLTDKNIKVKNNELRDFFTKNNITNDIELFEFLSKAKLNCNNIFTSKEEMKNNYIINYIISIALTTGKSISEINGDYIGYAINLQNGKEISILANNKRYIFTFIGNDYFTNDYIQEILNSIEVNVGENTKKESSYITKEINNVSMSISDITLTGAIVTIKDTNDKPYTYNEWYKLEKQINGKWYEIKTLIDNYGFNEIGYEVDKKNQVKFSIN